MFAKSLFKKEEVRDNLSRYEEHLKFFNKTNKIKMTIQAVFWDYDNTILATAEAHWQKHFRVLARYDISLPETFRKRIYHNNGSQNWNWLKDELGLKISEKEYLEEIDQEFQKNLFYLEMRPGVLHLFNVIESLKIPQAIVTNARRNSALPVLVQKKISPRMQFILCKEDYEGRKPDPAPYLRGFEKMGNVTGQLIDPSKCLVIEDDPLGVESASKAGALVVHRKLQERDPASPFATYSCFFEEDFVKYVHNLLI